MNERISYRGTELINEIWDNVQRLLTLRSQEYLINEIENYLGEIKRIIEILDLNQKDRR